MTVTTNDRAALLLRMIAEATRNDLLNPESVIYSLDQKLSIGELVYLKYALDMMSETYDKLLRQGKVDSNGGHI